ncbi:hypothetical protein TDB9533_04451 [Thalassocella blandensis]|nr:hypothetical protein TDB9533_04451 [Thalassocella blandensis]
MKFNTALELGRTSNIPTVWTNVICAIVMTQVAFDFYVVIFAALCLSLFYLAGMFLNDLFDIEWDTANNNPRPLVRGETTYREVLYFSLAFIVSAFVIICLVVFTGDTTMTPLHRVYPFAGAVLLLICILLYDWKHKAWSFSPWIMGACRLCVYLTAAGFVAAWNGKLAMAGLALLFYIAGITYLAKAEQQNRILSYVPAGLLFTPALVAMMLGYSEPMAWLLIAINLLWVGSTIVASLPNPQAPQKKLPVPKLVGRLLAGICLGDAMLVACSGHIFATVICVFAFVLCLLLQKRISAT